MVGILVSFGDGLLSGAMLVLGSVYIRILSTWCLSFDCDAMGTMGRLFCQTQAVPKTVLVDPSDPRPIISNRDLL